MKPPVKPVGYVMFAVSTAFTGVGDGKRRGPVWPTVTLFRSMLPLNVIDEVGVATPACPCRKPSEQSTIILLMFEAPHARSGARAIPRSTSSKRWEISRLSFY
jgi:hypothetical protein